MNYFGWLLIAAGVLICLWVVLAFALMVHGVWTDQQWDRHE